MPPFPFKKLIERLKEFYSDDVPVVTRLAARRHDPFLVLIGCLLSLRTKDETTDKAMERLTKTARTPKAILAMPVAEIEKAIYPVGFYRVKARLLRERVADHHREIRQPRARYARRAADYQGRWAENGQHRYHGGLRHPRRSSRHARTPHLEQAGRVRTRTPDETEKELAPASPEEYWIPFNPLLVTHGRRTCVPLSPFCSKCPVLDICGRVGVTRSR